MRRLSWLPHVRPRARAAHADAARWRERRDRGRTLRGGDDVAELHTHGMQALPPSWVPRAAASPDARSGGEAPEWPSDLPPFSPAGRALWAALKTALQPEVWPAARQATDGAFHARLLLALNCHPRIARAYSQAGVQVPCRFVTVLVWRFLSSPDSLYAVISTDPAGCVAVARRLGSSLVLRDHNVVCGQRPGRNIVVDFDTVEAAEYYRVFSRGRVGPGCAESLLGSLPEGLRLEVGTKHVPLPPASTTGEVFNWGNEDCQDYCAPPRGESSVAGGSATAATKDERKMEGRRLHTADPAAAHRALRAEQRRRAEAMSALSASRASLLDGGAF